MTDDEQEQIALRFIAEVRYEAGQAELPEVVTLQDLLDAVDANMAMLDAIEHVDPVLHLQVVAMLEDPSQAEHWTEILNSLFATVERLLSI
jgi:hypothetical protein